MPRERTSFTQPRTIRFTSEESTLIERQRRRGESFSDVVRRMLFSAYPTIRERAYQKYLAQERK